MKKKTSGRQKIEIKRIEKTENRLVTFTKRRKGVFKKASELCVLTGAQMAILVQSGGGHVFAFGHPSVDSVIDTYLGNKVSNSSPMSENLITCMYEEYNIKYEEICKELEVEKNKSKNVEKSEGFWWEKPFEDLEVEELEVFVNKLEELKINMAKKADELRINSGSSSPTPTDKIDDANIVDGSLDDQVILPSFDEFLPNNGDVGNEDLMTPGVNYDLSEFDNNNFEYGEFILDNHVDEHNDGGNDLHVQSDFGTFEIPNDLYLGHDQIQSNFGVPDLYFTHDRI